MNPSKIRFHCPSCHTQLDVPSELAGVTGPCPSCQATITAPFVDSPGWAAPMESAPPPRPAALPESSHYQGESPPAPSPQPIPIEQRSADSPPAQSPPVERGQAAFPPRSSEPQPLPIQPRGVTTATPSVHPTPAEPAFPLEEPAQAPRTADAPVTNVRKMSPESATEAQATPDPEQATRTTGGRKSRIPSLIFAVLFLAAFAAVIIGVLSLTGVVGLGDISSLLKPPGATAEDRAATTAAPTPLAPTTDGLPINPGSTAIPRDNNPLAIDPESPSAPSQPPLPVAPPLDDTEPATPPESTLPGGETFRQGETPLPVELDDEPSEAAEVQQALQSFFLAKSLQERSKTMPTTALSLPDIEKSVFAKRIPEPIFIRFIDTFRDTKENRSDFFFTVGWDGRRNTPKLPITVEMHRWHENETPRIHAEAFREAYEDDLRSYALAPQEKPRRFHVLGRCVAKCFSNLPNASKLATLKMAPFPGNYATTDAFFAKDSDLFKKLKNGMRGAAMEQDIPMTVTIAWSSPTAEPRYLELVRIDSFDWHP